MVKRLGEGLRNIPFAQVKRYGVAQWTTGLIIRRSAAITMAGFGPHSAQTLD
jgi:hypothetical protein